MSQPDYLKLFGLFDHRNMSTNKELAMESRESARKMEVLNIQMKDIATKTESETIVMRIVTLATLFFLPGTFVAVSHPFPPHDACCSPLLMHSDATEYRHCQIRG